MFLQSPDRANLDTPKREPFARLALRLNQYLSSAEPLRAGENEEELIPVDMSNYGFRDVPEVLDLCTAVGIRNCVYLRSAHFCQSHLSVRLQLVHVGILIPGTDWDGRLSPTRVFESLMRA